MRFLVKPNHLLIEQVVQPQVDHDEQAVQGREVDRQAVVGQHPDTLCDLFHEIFESHMHVQQLCARAAGLQTCGSYYFGCGLARDRAFR
ncbi:hypothetical protein ASE76_00050 [Xylophilus sp. Leaf220]|nr:hypothetical protein ASE76_00050 [Xylophilus sp. Leaf220]